MLPLYILLIYYCYYLRIIGLIECLGAGLVQLSPLVDGQGPLLGDLLYLLHIVDDNTQLAGLVAELEHSLEDQALGPRFLIEAAEHMQQAIRM